MKRLIALAGRAGSGKNTVARMLGGAEISFAAPLKRFAQEVFAFTDAQVFGPSEERNKPDERYPRAHGPWSNGQCAACGVYAADREPRQCYLTPRLALQTLGTEFGRTMYPNVWADLGVRRATNQLADMEARGISDPLVLITDCRFVNEAQAVRNAGGEVWRIVRPGAGLSGAAGLHPSEAEQESPEFLALVTRTVHNTDSLESLALQIT